MPLQGARHAYTVVGNPVASTNAYRLYLAKDTATDAWCLLQVAASRHANGGLSREAFILGRLADTSRAYDEAYGKTHEGHRLHYDRLYPQLIESFVSPVQGDRRINVLTFSDVNDIPRLTPLWNLRHKEAVILDPKTSAWIMGRLLKLLCFVHEQGIAVRSLGSNNILLDKEQHFAIVLDWTNAFVFPDKVSPDVAATDIACAAAATLASCGVTSDGSLPYIASSGDARYIDLLRTFADGTIQCADTAHTQFYDLVREIWGNEFHPFTTLPL